MGVGPGSDASARTPSGPLQTTRTGLLRQTLDSGRRIPASPAPYRKRELATGDRHGERTVKRPSTLYARPMTNPQVLFVCVHNAGRSQMAAGFLRHLGGDRVQVRSAGSMPGDRVNPVAVAAMAEVGIDISSEQPKVLEADAVKASDVVITMGCGDACPVFPGTRYLDWELDDPAGQGIKAVRPIRDEIEQRVRGLLADLGVGPER
jgi:arsenate reductase